VVKGSTKGGAARRPFASERSRIAALFAPKADLFENGAVRIAEQDDVVGSIEGMPGPVRSDEHVILLECIRLIADLCGTFSLSDNEDRALGRAVWRRAEALRQQLDECRYGRQHVIAVEGICEFEFDPLRGVHFRVPA